MGSGTAGFVTTALPSAASVGASIVARIATSRIPSPGKSRTPVPIPSRIVSGSPIRSSRPGSRTTCRSTGRFAFEASLKSTSARVSSAIVRSPSLPSPKFSNPSPTGPAITPKTR
jgi:hypothetical protein